MKTRIPRFILLAVLLFGLLLPVPVGRAAPAKPVQARGLSPQGFLNSDGTLKLDGSLNGALDLSGWNVRIDPQRGPVFDLSENGAAAPQAANPWSSLGSGGSSLNGTVFAIAISGSMVYVGGNFTDADNKSEADYLAAWDGTQWSALSFGLTGDGALNGPVYALAVSGTDLYVGGNFTDVCNRGTAVAAADYIAKWDGTQWSALGSDATGDGSLNSAVNAIAVNGSDVYVGGHFTNVSNLLGTLNGADYIAKWDGSFWSALGSNGADNGSLNAPVYAITLNGSDLYVGGDFTNVNNNGTLLNAADYITKWDGASWNALGGASSGNGSLNNDVHAIVVDGSNLYVGGDFTNVAQGSYTLLAADYVAGWNGTGWSPLGSNGAGNGSLGGNVRTLVLIGSDLYVGGEFTNVNNGGTILDTTDYVAKWDGASWSALGDNGAGDGALGNKVFALAVSGSNLVVGGNFTNVHDGGVSLLTADYTAIWNGTDWSGLSSSPTTGALNEWVNAVAVIGSDVYVGGDFTDVNNKGTILTAADYIAKWDGSNWSALSSDGAGNGSLKGGVYALAVSGSNLYVGGIFSNVNDNGITLTTADYIAKWDGGNWAALGSDGASNGSLNAFVFALAVSGSDLYVGGQFSNVNNQGTVLTAADYVAKWDGANWSALGSNGAGSGSLHDMVRALAVSGSDLYVGGWFTDVNNNGAVLTAADYIAKWDGSSWSGLGSDGAGNGSLNGKVYALAVSGSNLYVGGTFTDVNNNGTVLTAADYIAKWDGASWAALGSDGAGNGALLYDVYALAVSGSDLYAGGEFVVKSGSSYLEGGANIAKWNGNNWSPLDTDGAWHNVLNGRVYALAVNGSNLYAGGQFTDPIDNGVILAPADYVAAYAMPSDTTPPTVLSITRASPNPTYAASVDFLVTFSEPVINVYYADDFTLTTSGVSGAAVTWGHGSGGNTYTVTVSTGSGSGTIRLDVADSDFIMDMAGNPLGGSGAGNGNFTTGEVYTVGLYPTYLPLAQRP